MTKILLTGTLSLDQSINMNSSCIFYLQYCLEIAKPDHKQVDRTNNICYIRTQYHSVRFTWTYQTYSGFQCRDKYTRQKEYCRL